MALIYLGLGSNIEPEKNLRLAARELRRRFHVTNTSSVYSSKAVGFDGDNFLNLVIEAHTEIPPEDVLCQLEEIHKLAGRERDEQRFASRELDIDLLLYGQVCVRNPRLTLPRDDVLEFEFVLLPLAELAPDLVHPVTRRTIADHCRDLAPGSRQATVTELVL